MLKLKKFLGKLRVSSKIISGNTEKYETQTRYFGIQIQSEKEGLRRILVLKVKPDILGNI